MSGRIILVAISASSKKKKNPRRLQDNSSVCVGVADCTITLKVKLLCNDALWVYW